MIRFWLGMVFCAALFSCSVSKKNYAPNQKFPRTQLQQDFSLLRNILEKKHPALYWYTSKDSMDFYFDSLYRIIPDSMTELQFGWNIIAPLTQKIHCGHTSFGLSNNWGKFLRNRTIPSFPFYVKVWSDTMVVTGTIGKKDSLIKNGTLITSINGVKNAELIKQLFQYLPTDGYATNVNYLRLSNNFPFYHRSVFGLYKNYRIGFIDSMGNEQSKLVPYFFPDTSTQKKPSIKRPSISKKLRRQQEVEAARFLSIDTAKKTGFLNINTFSNGEGRHLRRFLRRSFKQLNHLNIQHLVIDLRSNGGGDVGISSLLTRYIRQSKFKVADTVYAQAKGFGPYSKYIHQGRLSNIGLWFITKKKKDGMYHFGFFERHWFHPKKSNHFNGSVYVLTNGPTFSAATLFCNAVKGQANVELVGEETGGGWHGNSGLLIPDITLPHTRLRVRLPFFKIVQFNHVPKTGSGVIPDVLIPPSVEGVRLGIDRKLQYVLQQIDQQLSLHSGQ